MYSYVHMSATNIVQMSALIVSAAGSARVAQAIMSTGTDPMTIKKFRFKVNFTTDWELKTSTDVNLTIWRIGIKSKIDTDYKEHFGVEIECEIAPTVSP